MRRILILDDEIAVLHALERVLHLAFPGGSVHVEAFSEPEAALLRVGEEDFDVVLSDLRMPGLTGADVLQLIKGLQPAAVRIVLSATTERNDIIAAVNRAEVFRFLAKPWQSAELIATLHAAFAYRDAHLQVSTPPASAQERELLRLEREEPGMTFVDRDAHGNVRLG